MAVLQNQYMKMIYFKEITILMTIAIIFLV